MSYVRPPGNAANASFEGAEVYTKPPGSAADGDFSMGAVADYASMLVFDGVQWVSGRLNYWTGTEWGWVIPRHWDGAEWSMK